MSKRCGKKSPDPMVLADDSLISIQVRYDTVFGFTVGIHEKDSYQTSSISWKVRAQMNILEWVGFQSRKSLKQPGAIFSLLISI